MSPHIQGRITSEGLKLLFNFEGPVKDSLRRRVGGVAQLGEHLFCKQGVIGSIPFISTRRAEPADTQARKAGRFLLAKCAPETKDAPDGLQKIGWSRRCSFFEGHEGGYKG